MLEDIGNTGSMRNMLMAYPTWQQNNNQTWSPDTAYVQHLACDSHYQTPWSPTYWKTDRASKKGDVMNSNVLYTNMMNSNVMNYNSGYLNNAAMNLIFGS